MKKEKIEEKLNKIKIRFQKELERGENISFFDWECPPRRKRIDSDGQVWFDFDLDLEKIINGEKVDEFTELPRIITRESDTRDILILIRKIFGNKASFFKIVADTNWLYLYPKTLKNLGEKKLSQIAKNFKKLLQEKSDKMFGRNRIKVINFTKLQGQFKKEYEDLFDIMLSNFKKFVPKKIKKQWESRLNIHIDLSDKEMEYRKDLVKRVIASYAAEGVIFDLLDSANILSNPVWINFDEPEFAIKNTEILRKRKNIKELPVLIINK